MIKKLLLILGISFLFISNSWSMIEIDITEGNRFLHHMVRYLVGTMIACSQKKINSDDFTNLLENPIKDAKIFKAPANGLILNKIYYEN